ncbi:hypothetical protein DFAR_690001 [Desulfarculales bacterium]
MVYDMSPAFLAALAMECFPLGDGLAGLGGRRGVVNLAVA